MYFTRRVPNPSPTTYDTLCVREGFVAGNVRYTMRTQMLSNDRSEDPRSWKLPEVGTTNMVERNDFSI